MFRAIRKTLPAIALVALATLWLMPRTSGQTGRPAATGVPGSARGEWTHYTADVRGSKYSPLDQISAANFGKLEVAWRFKTDNLGPRPEYNLEGTPLMVNGFVYATAGTRKAVVKLDARTGELKWMYSMDEGRRAEVAPRRLSGRGVSYWTDGKGDERIYLVTMGYRLVALNAANGQPVNSFGTNGVVDLKVGVMTGKPGTREQTQIDLVEGEIGLHSTPTVTGSTIIVGSSFLEGLNYRRNYNSKGLVRAFDVRTGKQIWRFNTMPAPGEFGHDTWDNNSWYQMGNTGVWTQITVDEEAGLVYLPVETPTVDLYGGDRPGTNLFAESLVAVDLRTGVRKWHFQFVHHPLWDHDMSSAPLLADVTVDGKPRKVVAVPSKQSYLYVFDRLTGQPIWPMPETPVPASDVPGEKAWPTQPIPSKPPMYARAFLKKDDLIDFTPEMRTQALENLKMYRWLETPYIPPVVPSATVRGAINVGNASGGTNWPGASVRSRAAYRCSRRPTTRRLAAPTCCRFRPIAATRATRPAAGEAAVRKRVSSPSSHGLGAAAALRKTAPSRPPAEGAAAQVRLRRLALRQDLLLAGSTSRGCPSSSRPTGCCRPSTSIAASFRGRCRTARRRTTSGTTRHSRASTFRARASPAAWA